MNNRMPVDFCQRCDDQKKKIDKRSYFGALKDLSSRSMHRLKNGGGNPDSHHEQDPTHVDFWAIGNLRDGAFFDQVPLFVFIPLMRKLLLAAADDAQYFDFCLRDHDYGAFKNIDFLVVKFIKMIDLKIVISKLIEQCHRALIKKKKEKGLYS